MLKEISQLRQTLRAQPYYVPAEWNSFNSWLTQKIRSTKTVTPKQYLKDIKEKQRMKVASWFKALVTDKPIHTDEVAKIWRPENKTFNSGTFREHRTELALLSLKAEGKIQDFHPAHNVSAHDALGIDFWVELKPQGCFQKIFPLQVKSSSAAAKSFRKMHIHYSDHLREMLSLVDPQMVKSLDTMGFDGHSKRDIPVIIAKDKSISDIKKEILSTIQNLGIEKKLILKPSNTKKTSVQDAGRPETLSTLFQADLVRPVVSSNLFVN